MDKIILCICALLYTCLKSSSYPLDIGRFFFAIFECRSNTCSPSLFTCTINTLFRNCTSGNYFVVTTCSLTQLNCEAAQSDIALGSNGFKLRLQILGAIDTWQNIVTYIHQFITISANLRMDLYHVKFIIEFGHILIASIR